MTATIIIGLLVHVLVFYFLAFIIVVRKSPFKLISHLRSVFLQTFSRASAGTDPQAYVHNLIRLYSLVAALPKAREVLETHYNVPNNISRFLMTMGGRRIYITFFLLSIRG